VVEVKFCGLTREGDASRAASLGATHIGVIFAGGPRELTPARAGEVLSAAGNQPKRVGVFGADFRTRLRSVTAVARLDVVQLHGDPTPADVSAARDLFDGEVWTAVRVRGAEIPDGVADLFATADAVLFDPRVDGVLGGTGKRLDWATLGPALAHSRGSDGRVVLAGGLTPENVTEAIAAIRPAIVDVSSGVESAPGVKDHARMTAFAEAVRRSNR
jgi:phosphoribosylanthranilate isomerase